MSQILGMVMAVVSIVMAVWFERYWAAASTRRLMAMMRHLALDPGMGANGDPRIEAIMKAARRRCRRCAVEGLCERWLVAKVTGDNTFCPNAATFRMLARTTDRTA